MKKIWWTSVSVHFPEVVYCRRDRKKCPQSRIGRCPHSRGSFPAKTAWGDRKMSTWKRCPYKEVLLYILIDIPLCLYSYTYIPMHTPLYLYPYFYSLTRVPYEYNYHALWWIQEWTRYGNIECIEYEEIWKNKSKERWNIDRGNREKWWLEQSLGDRNEHIYMYTVTRIYQEKEREKYM